ncbi:MAG TPA: hypothetical protein VGX76_02930, partial [Pirellulales bacterium]|nr:hypothetical protein [Pirellulales bacterium]
MKRRLSIHPSSFIFRLSPFAPRKNALSRSEKRHLPLPTLLGGCLIVACLAAAPLLHGQDDEEQAEAPKSGAAPVRIMRSRAKDPTVRELLATDPKTPAELVRVA